MSALPQTHKVLGKRSLRMPSGTPSGEQLDGALRFKDEMHRMFPSGYRPQRKLLSFKTLEEADQYDHQSLIQAMESIGCRAKMSEKETIRVQDKIVVKLVFKSCGETFDTYSNHEMPCR